MNSKTAIAGIRRERLCRISLPLLAKWNGHSRYCLSPQGYSIGCGEMSLEQLKDGNRSERRMPPIAESRMKYTVKLLESLRISKYLLP